MCYTNVLQVLDIRIPLHACERGGCDPIVIGGGPARTTRSRWPISSDLFYIGEGRDRVFRIDGPL